MEEQLKKSSNKNISFFINEGYVLDVSRRCFRKKTHISKLFPNSGPTRCALGIKPRHAGHGAARSSERVLDGRARSPSRARCTGQKAGTGAVVGLVLGMPDSVHSLA